MLPKEMGFTIFEQGEDEHFVDLGEWGKFKCKYVIPDERKAVGLWFHTYGEKPVPSILSYVPVSIEEEAKLLNDMSTWASDFLNMKWIYWKVEAGDKTVKKGDKREIVPKIAKEIPLEAWEINTEEGINLTEIDLGENGRFEVKTMRLYNNWKSCLYGIWYPNSADSHGLPSEMYFTVDYPASGILSREIAYVSDGVVRCQEKWDYIKPTGEPLELIMNDYEQER